jgi:signal transduction histidine kinase/ActR/RegA family two-component response regulator
LSIRWRLGLLVLALAVPFNLVILGGIWSLADQANRAQRTSLLYTARSIAAGVDTKLEKYLALGATLASSPSVLDDKLDAFEAEARRSFPAGRDAWVAVLDINGQQLLNTLAQPGKPLPRRSRLGLETQKRALATGSIVISDVLKGPIAQDWLVTIEVPIFKGGRPFRGLAVVIRAREFLPLLSVRDIPSHWRVAIIDGQGRFIARAPKGAAEIGELAAQGWRATKEGTGIFETVSLEGEPLIRANVHPSIVNWTVGVAVKKAELQAAAWNAVHWAIVLGAGLSAASIVLASILSRQITRPITQLRQSLADISVERDRPIAVGPPEIIALQDTLYRAAIEQQKSHQALIGTLSKLEHEMNLREHAQAALAHSHRMEAVGQLAGGISHDFNNVLAAISSYLDMVTLRTTDEKARKAAQGARDAIEMGASLNRRLLSFSRQHGVGLERIDLNDRVTGTIDLLQRTLGDQVTVTLRCCPDPCPILANAGDIDNAILNLAINARDAMPNGGVLAIETRHITLDALAATRISNARPGDFVTLIVRDTGQGMSTNVLRRAMEPFFTTKEHGTGLGLATVYGAAKQSGGFVDIRSGVGEGTTVQLYLPKTEAGPNVSRATFATSEAPLGDGERILVVEDNDKVREATVDRLESLGYAVLQARTGSEAIKLLESGERVDLVFTDVVMPGGVSGYDVAEWVRSKNRDVKIVLSSAHSDIPLASGSSIRTLKLLAKPYSREQLAYALCEALNSKFFSPPAKSLSYAAPE